MKVPKKQNQTLEVGVCCCFNPWNPPSSQARILWSYVCVQLGRKSHHPLVRGTHLERANQLTLKFLNYLKFPYPFFQFFWLSRGNSWPHLKFSLNGHGAWLWQRSARAGEKEIVTLKLPHAILKGNTSPATLSHNCIGARPHVMNSGW